MAEAKSSTSMATKVDPPVTSIKACASMPMTPTSERAPTMMNRPAKKTSVVHSTCARASSMRSPEISMRTPAAVSATTQDSMPSEPWAMKPTTTSTIMTTLWRRRTGFLELLALVEARERVFVRVVDVELPAEQQVEQREHHGKREQRRRGVVEDEVDERVARRRADHDVGRVADERCRAADVGGL